MTRIKNIIFASHTEVSRFARTPDLADQKGPRIVSFDGRPVLVVAGAAFPRSLEVLVGTTPPGVETIIVPASKYTCTGWRIIGATVHLTAESFALERSKDRKACIEQALNRGGLISMSNLPTTAWGSIEHCLRTIAEKQGGAA